MSLSSSSSTGKFPLGSLLDNGAQSVQQIAKDCALPVMKGIFLTVQLGGGSTQPERQKGRKTSIPPNNYFKLEATSESVTADRAERIACSSNNRLTRSNDASYSSFTRRFRLDSATSMSPPSWGTATHPQKPVVA
jgi:hypothetical protein